MAIDTAEKRANVAMLGKIFTGPNITPDSTLDKEDRQHIGYGYLGIAASGPSAFQAAWAAQTTFVAGYYD